MSTSMHSGAIFSFCLFFFLFFSGLARIPIQGLPSAHVEPEVKRTMAVGSAMGLRRVKRCLCLDFTELVDMPTSESEHVQDVVGREKKKGRELFSSFFFWELRPDLTNLVRFSQVQSRGWKGHRINQHVHTPHCRVVVYAEGTEPYFLLSFHSISIFSHVGFRQILTSE
ncbi:hypothetical protein M0657_009569 [Pyricularia oryzae]|nr:hypothetical protein M0657_009569 [Pyricularia oryzae]KAI7917333.1 hypothetical protein M9X92_007417 [Pyricularia oryzae]